MLNSNYIHITTKSVSRGMLALPFRAVISFISFEPHVFPQDAQMTNLKALCKQKIAAEDKAKSSSPSLRSAQTY